MRHLVYTSLLIVISINSVLKLKWLSSVLIGSLSSNSEATVTALSSNYCFQNKMAAENPLANISSKKKLKKLKHILFNLKAKEATIYGLTFFRKTKAPFSRCLKQFIWQFKTGK
jgi:NhaP-type Na+/H+ and K+/H+ antiporter